MFHSPVVARNIHLSVKCISIHSFENMTPSTQKARLAHASIHKMKSVWLFYPKSFHMSALAQESAFMGNSLEIIASHINQSR